MRPTASGNKRTRTAEVDDVGEPELCIANINAAGRRRRMAMGVVVLVGAVAASRFLHGAFLPVYLVGPLPIFFGWLCLMQATDRT